MVWWWITAALAQSAGFVGFSEAGRVATYVTLEPSSVGHVATVRSVNVSQGTWNHLPSRAEASTSVEAIDKAKRLRLAADEAIAKNVRLAGRGAGRITGGCAAKLERARGPAPLVGAQHTFILRSSVFLALRKV